MTADPTDAGPRSGTKPRPRPRPAPTGRHHLVASADSEPAAERAPLVADDRRPVIEGDDFATFAQQVFVAQRAAPRRLRRIPSLMLDAAALVWRTSRLQTAGIVGSQLISAAFAALTVLLGGAAVRELLRLERSDGLGQLLVPLLLLAVVATVGGLVASASSQFGRLLGARVERTVTGKLLDVTTEVDLIDYDDADFHNQLNRVLVNVPTRPYQVVTCLASLIGGVAGVGALVVTLALIQPLLVPILIVGGVPLWFLSRKGSRLEFNFAVSQTASQRERDYLEEILTARQDAAEVRAYNTAPPLRQRWNELYDDFLEALRVQVRRRYTLASLSGLASGVILVATLLALIALVRSGTIGLAQAAAAAVAIRLLSTRMQQLISGLSTLFESSLFLSDYDEFLRRRPLPREPVVDGIRDSTFTGLQASNVSFRYPQSTVDAVTGIDIELKPGEVVALVGENGSGKTTLAKILAGLYQPRAGVVELNSSPVADDWALRDQVALVLQDFTHYALSAAQNIAFGRPEDDLTQERVVEAAQRVGADEFIGHLPDGYETRLSRLFEGGRELSLGQWQRVALARAFYRNAPIVILDEPTAALDPRAEARLYDSVRSVLAGRTVLLITHRLASVRGADRIVVLDRGRIVEQGDHDLLITRGGLYAELVGLQQNRHVGAARDGAIEEVPAQ